MPYDDRLASFGASYDLTAAKKSDLGELQITLTQNPITVIRGVDHFAWEATIEVLGGSLIEATDPYKNLAPDGSYQSAFSFAQSKDNPNWANSLTKTFYVHTANGQFGKVSIDLTPGTNRSDIGLGIGLSIETWINPSGSRNLEFDPSKQIRPGAGNKGGF